MKYAMKVIDTKKHSGSGWRKTERGWESWCDDKLLYNTANQAYQYMAKYQTNYPIATYYYEICEVEE